MATREMIMRLTRAHNPEVPDEPRHDPRLGRLIFILLVVVAVGLLVTLLVSVDFTHG